MNDATISSADVRAWADAHVAAMKAILAEHGDFMMATKDGEMLASEAIARAERELRDAEDAIREVDEGIAEFNASIDEFGKAIATGGKS